MYIKNNKSGMTLIETMGVLAIGITLVAGGLYLYNDVSSENKKRTTIQQATTMYTKTMQKFSNESTTSGFNSQVAYKMGSFPSSTRPNINGGTNEFGGSISAMSYNGNEGFAYIFEKIPQQACVALLSGNKNTGWDSFRVNNGTEYPYRTSSIANYTQACSNVDENRVMLIKNKI